MQLAVNLWTHIHATALNLSKAWGEYSDRNNWFRDEYPDNFVLFEDVYPPVMVQMPTPYPPDEIWPPVHSEIVSLLLGAVNIDFIGPFQQHVSYDAAMRCRQAIEHLAMSCEQAGVVPPLKIWCGKNGYEPNPNLNAILDSLSSTILSIVQGASKVVDLLNKPGATFFSVHQFPCYPGTGTRNVGSNCFNFPIVPQTSRAEYRQVLESALEHLQTCKPGLVAVSAGFDAYARDPLAQGSLEAEDYYWIGQFIRNLGVPAFSLLEGGYSADLPDLILAYLKGLEGK